MDDIPGSAKTEDSERHGLCPFCLARTDVHLDIKGRPYWRCWRCEVRTFGTKTTLRTLTADGWIWSGPQPLAALRAWFGRIAGVTGLADAPRSDARVDEGEAAQ